MKFHWMQRLDSDTLESLEKYSEILNDSGYESILTVYHSTIADNWIKAARVLNKNHKFKYMIAIRTYAISPEYCAMMCKAFYEIAEDRLILNILAGDLQKEEESVNNVIEINDLIKTHEERTVYTKRWLEKFVNLNIFKNNPNIKPQLIMSGTSKQTLENAELFGDGHLCTYANYKFDLKDQIKTKIKMVYIDIVVRDSYEDCIKYIPGDENRIQKESTIVGTETQVIEKLKEMKKEGITEIMVCRRPEDEEHHRIHALIKKINNENLLDN